MQIGQVVLSLAGRDTGKYFAVLGSNDRKVLICDGKERPLQHPKCKSEKHLRATEYVLSSEQLKTNKALKKALKAF